MTLDEARQLINTLNEELTARRLTLGDCMHELHQQRKLIASLRKEIQVLRTKNI